MPGVSGSVLLAEVSNQYPDIIRIVLSGMCDREEALSSVAGAHQFLAKPCDAGLLKKAVERALTVKNDLAKGALKNFISRITSLPSPPSLYNSLIEAAQDPLVSTLRIGSIVAQDVAMTSKVLQIVNSPLFGIQRSVLNPADACVFLGTDTIQTLVLSIGVFSQFHTKGHFRPEEFQAHSMQTANLARRIAKFEQLPKDAVDASFLAGMLHDVGKLVMAVNCPAEYDLCLLAAEADGRPLHAIESEVFGVNHADAGMYLLRLWNLPETVTAAVAAHHVPAQSPGRTLGPLAIVHAANLLVRNPEAQAESGLDLEYLAAVGATSALQEWRRLAREVATEDRA
jgi:putative nucleotidyltransferase with HDIG domain